VHIFAILPLGPAKFYEIWQTRLVSNRRNHVCQIFSRSVQGLQSSDSRTLCKYTVVNNSRLLNSNYRVNIVRECEYLPALQTLMTVVDSKRQKIAAAIFILQRTWQQVIIRKAVIVAHTTAQTSAFLVFLFCPA